MKIHRNFYLAPENLRHTLYITLVRPILEYSCATWHPFNKTLTNCLEPVQIFACRVILQCWNFEHDDILSRTSLPTLGARRDCSTVVLVFKTLAGLSSAPNVFIPHTRSDSRLNHSRVLYLYIPFSRLTLCQRSFFHLGPKLWNKLPENVASCVTLPTFKAAQFQGYHYGLVVFCDTLSVYFALVRFFFGFVALFDCLGYPLI